jgi:anti-anti-sigma regulatory factor
MSALTEPLRRRNVSRQRLGECTCVLTVEGRFTSRAALGFARELEAARSEGCTDFVFDFTDVGSVDSIAAMIFCEQRMRLFDCSVVIAAHSPEAIITIADAPVLADWPLRPTRDEALSALLLEPVA